MKYGIFLVLTAVLLSVNAQNATNSVNDPDATALLQKVSDRYKSYKSISSSFKLLVMRPKVRPQDDERKLTDTLQGKVTLQGNKFNINISGQHIICDGKNIWTYIPADKEVQINYYEETDDIFSPSKIFTFYRDGYSYQLKERKTVGGKKIAVVEMSPTNKKVSYFKIDVTVDEATLQILESKVYEKNGTRYVYLLSKQIPDVILPDDTFTFDARKYPGVKVVDLR